MMLPPVSDQAQARMRVINADGSEPEMCGNGIRCVAKALHDHVERFHGLDSVIIDTGAGPLGCNLTRGEDGRVRSVCVDMGRPRLDRSALPMVGGTGPFIEGPIQAAGTELLWTAVSMGNPHIVTFVEDPALDLRDMAERLGPAMERHPLFPARTNVELVRMRPDGARVWVWERGCGITQACGTGACAVATAATLTNRHPVGRPLRVTLPGGTLTIEVAAQSSRVWMDGPAVEVFSGELELERFA